MSLYIFQAFGVSISKVFFAGLHSIFTLELFVLKTKTKPEKIITTTPHTENGFCAQQQSVWSFPILGPTVAACGRRR
jgi:hypothetical protein